MDILITGSSGLLGQKLLTTLHKETNRLSGIDLTDRSLVVDVPHRYSRIDLTVRMGSRVYIIEFKVTGKKNDSPNALKQIKEKVYHDKYRQKGIDIYLIGVEFEKVERNIINFEWEKIV